MTPRMHSEREYTELVAWLRTVKRLRAEMRLLRDHADPIERISARAWHRQLCKLERYLAERDRQAKAYQKSWH